MVLSNIYQFVFAQKLNFLEEGQISFVLKKLFYNYHQKKNIRYQIICDMFCRNFFFQCIFKVIFVKLMKQFSQWPIEIGQISLEKFSANNNEADTDEKMKVYHV